MGPCLSKCIVNDIGNEFEAELDGPRTQTANGGGQYREPPETSKMASSGTTGNGSAAQNAFGPTSLLAANEVVCLNVLGEGPSGVIYKGTYRGSVVAVKKMRMVSLPAKPGAREVIESALEVEATRMGSLRHPNTVLFMGACLQGDYFCIVSEYCHLGSLYDVLRSRGESSSKTHRRKRKEQAGAASEPTFHSTDGKKTKRKPIKWLYRIRVAKSAAQGLLYLHSADPPLVHGMLKSTNILVDDSWNAKIADFGTRRVAEAVGFDRRRMENVDTETGLLRWTAPELLKLGEDRVLKGQFPSNQAFPQATDIYSFGIIMWELTSCELPFASLTTNRDIREHVVNGNRPPMGANDGCSVKWAELLTRCWSSNPARRPNAAEIVSILEKIYEEELQAKAQKRQAVNSNRADYTYARTKPSRNQTSRFASNVRLPDESPNK